MAVSKHCLNYALALCLGLALTGWSQTPQTQSEQGEKGEDKKEGEKKDEKEKAFDEVVKDAQVLKGLFTLYRKPDEDKTYLEVLPEQFGVLYLFSPTLTRGIGERGLYGTMMGEEFVFCFDRSGKTVQWLKRNVWYRAADRTPAHRAVEQSFSDSVVGTAKIQSKPHLESKSVLVDLDDLMLVDLPGISPWLEESYKTAYKFNRSGSGVGVAKAFPENVELEVTLHYTTDKPKEPSITLPDPRSIRLTFHYSLSSIAATDYRPRLADDRVGHFLAMYQDFTDDDAETPYVRYITRWHLEKADPNLAVSPPKKPIVFWLENTIPERYRTAIGAGVLLWNRAFERAGFKDALVVKQQPDDADWDPADTRYNTIRWFVGADATFAIGPSRANPFTGQIYDADIGISEGIIRFTRRQFEEFVAPTSLEPEPPPLPLRPRDPARFCVHAEGLASQAALGYSLLQSRGELSPEEEEKYIYQYIVELTAHEVGHTLGLRHNFRASTLQPVSELHHRKRTEELGLSGSVMDYNPVNLAVQGEAQGDYFPTTLGPYDYWAIEYAYGEVPGARSATDELPELRRIASRVADPKLAYGTDEDSFGFSPRGIDPRTNQWDYGDDPIAFYRTRMTIVNELWENIDKKLPRPGEGYQSLRRAFSQGVREQLRAALFASKYVGGIYHHRDHAGDPNGRLPYVPVAAAKQKEALAFLNRHIFGPQAFSIRPDLLTRLAMERHPDFGRSVWTAERLEYPLHAQALSIQGLVLDRMYHPIVLSRVLDASVMYAKAADRFTLSDLFGGLLEGIWSEVKGPAGTRINSFRRNAQREHLNRLIALLLKPAPGTPEDARTLARANLLTLRAQIDRALAAGGQDSITRAHLQESRARADQALSAQLQRLQN